jgi:hypothetical protein
MRIDHGTHTVYTRIPCKLHRANVIFVLGFVINDIQCSVLHAFPFSFQTLMATALWAKSKSLEASRKPRRTSGAHPAHIYCTHHNPSKG